MVFLKVPCITLFLSVVFAQMIIQYNKMMYNTQTNKAVKVWFNDVKVVRSIFLFDDEMSHQSESVVTSPLLQS